MVMIDALVDIDEIQWSSPLLWVVDEVHSTLHIQTFQKPYEASGSDVSTYWLRKHAAARARAH
jgi:hypothetical protein